VNHRLRTLELAVERIADAVQVLILRLDDGKYAEGQNDGTAGVQRRNQGAGHGSTAGRAVNQCEGTVSGCARRAGQGINSELATVATQKRERIGHLIIDNLEAEMEATKAMTNVFKDEQWLRKQEASQLAVLYGVIKDKTHRVLEALPDDADDLDRE